MTCSVDCSCPSQQLNTVPTYVHTNTIMYVRMSVTICPNDPLSSISHLSHRHMYLGMSNTYEPEPSLSLPHHSPVVHGAVQQLSQFSTMAPLLGHCRDACTPLSTATIHTHHQLNHLKLRTHIANTQQHTATQRKESSTSAPSPIALHPLHTLTQ